MDKQAHFCIIICFFYFQILVSFRLSHFSSKPLNLLCRFNWRLLLLLVFVIIIHLCIVSPFLVQQNTSLINHSLINNMFFLIWLHAHELMWHNEEKISKSRALRAIRSKHTHTHKNDGFCLVTQTLIFITLLTSEFGWFDEHVLLPLILCDNFFSFVQSLFFFFVFLRKRKWTNYNNLRDSLWRKRNPNNENKRQSKTRFIEKEEHDDDDDNHKKKTPPKHREKKHYEYLWRNFTIEILDQIAFTLCVC